ncbi:hypothetical protein [Amycolatopsis methanolica]|uniref:hypothetical protein n=1 Tax=Amycolatopsis methanolica TaxID=1814 RepID=UPI001ADF4823|nr:hypothetical protein [Amycolatopsis methanolica]
MRLGTVRNWLMLAAARPAEGGPELVLDALGHGQRGLPEDAHAAEHLAERQLRRAVDEGEAERRGDAGKGFGDVAGGPGRAGIAGRVVERIGSWCGRKHERHQSSFGLGEPG